MRIRLIVPLVLVLTAALLVPGAAQARTSKVRKHLAVPTAGQVNLAVFQVKVKGNVKPKLRLKGTVDSDVFAVGALHKVKGQRHRYIGEVAILRKPQSASSRSLRAVAPAPTVIVIELSVPAGKVRFTEYDIAEAVIAVGRKLGVDVCDPDIRTELVGKVGFGLLELGLKPDPDWDQDDFYDMLDDAYYLACDHLVSKYHQKLLMLLADYTAAVVFSANHNPSAGASNGCFRMMTSPAQGGGRFVSVLTGPGGYTDTQSGTLDSQGIGVAVHRITRFGDYSDVLTITSPLGLIHTWTVPSTVNGTEKPGPGCPAVQ